MALRSFTLHYQDRTGLSKLLSPWFLPIYTVHPQTHIKGLDLSAKGQSNVLEAPDLIHTTQMPWTETSTSTVTNNHPSSAPPEHSPAWPAAGTVDRKPWTKGLNALASELFTSQVTPCKESVLALIFCWACSSLQRLCTAWSAQNHEPLGRQTYGKEEEGQLQPLTLNMGCFVIFLRLFWFSFLNILYIKVSMKKCICKQTSVQCSPFEDLDCLDSSPLFMDLLKHPSIPISPAASNWGMKRHHVGDRWRPQTARLQAGHASLSQRGHIAPSKPTHQHNTLKIS